MRKRKAQKLNDELMNIDLQAAVLLCDEKLLSALISKDFEIDAQFLDDKEEILQFLRENLTKMHPRNNYKEFLELCIIFLGGISSKHILNDSDTESHFFYCLRALRPNYTYRELGVYPSVRSPRQYSRPSDG